MRAIIVKRYLNGPAAGSKALTVCQSSEMDRLINDELIANPCSVVRSKTARYAMIHVDTTRGCFGSSGS